LFANHEGDTRFPEFESQFPISELIETHDTFEIRKWSRELGS